MFDFDHVIRAPHSVNLPDVSNVACGGDNFPTRTDTSTLPNSDFTDLTPQDTARQTYANARIMKIPEPDAQQHCIMPINLFQSEMLRLSHNDLEVHVPNEMKQIMYRGNTLIFHS